MNRWIKRMLIGAMILIAVLAGCKGDDGPAGPAGTATCMNCHTDSYAMDDYLVAIGTQHTTSLHMTTNTYLRKTAPCSGCHTAEGYQGYVSTGTLPTSELPQSSPIGCFACHAPHTNENFAMRKTGATTMTVGGGTYDKQESNTCAMCHQLRVPSPNFMLPTFVSDSVTSTRFAGHYGAQSNTLSGQGLWAFTGSSAYPAEHMHHTGIAKGCVGCHMADVPGGSMVGGHSFAIAYMSGTDERINSKGCIGCHAGDMPKGDADAITYVDEAKHAFLAALNDTLAPRLVTLGLLKLNTDGTYSPNGTRRDGTGRRALWTKDELGAIFNYGALLRDRSGSVHNPTYTNAVLRATLAWANTQ